MSKEENRRTNMGLNEDAVAFGRRGPFVQLHGVTRASDYYSDIFRS